MCNIPEERKRIDEILEQAIAHRPVFDEFGADTMVEEALTALRAHYADFCSEECMRARCEGFVARMMRRRWASGDPVSSPQHI